METEERLGLQAKAEVGKRTSAYVRQLQSLKMVSKETVPHLQALQEHLDRIIGGGGEQHTGINWKLVLAWWNQTSFSGSFRHYFAM